MLPCTATGARSTHWKVMRRMGTRVVCSQRACTLPHECQDNTLHMLVMPAALGGCASPQLHCGNEHVRSTTQAWDTRKSVQCEKEF